MLKASPDHSLLIAFSSGLPPHAEPLICEDMRGGRSLFGETSTVPRPKRCWADADTDAAASICCLNDDNRPLKTACGRGKVLWEDTTHASPFEIAKSIHASPDTSLHAITANELSVPAATYIAGNCTSSFSVAWSLHEQGLLPEWGTVLCSRQKEGRGQTRREWHSPRGNLYVTFRLPDDSLLQGDAASLITGYLLVQGLRALGFPLVLKWPNDILTLDGYKVGGILLEERQGVLLAGVGINLAEAPAAAKLRAESATRAGILLPCEEATGRAAEKNSPEREADELFAPFALWRALVSEAILEYTCTVAGKRLPDILSDIEGLLAWKGQTVTLSEGDGNSLSGQYVGLGQGGGLLLQCPDGVQRELCNGSLSLGASHC